MSGPRKPRSSAATPSSGTVRSPRAGGRRAGGESRPGSDAAAASSAPSSVRPNLLIRASAGSGKTFQLSGEYIDRLRRSEPDRILATTFTRAAAGEILERILVRLAEAALTPSKLQELARQVHSSDSESFTREQCLSRLADLTRNLHRARVSTLDSFFIQLAQCFALELGLPPGWRILDSIEENQLVTQAVERLLHRGSAGDVGRLLNLLARGNAARTVTGLLRKAVRDFYEVYCETTAAAWQRIPEPEPLSSDDLQWAIQDLDRIPVPQSWEKAKSLEHACAAEGRWEDFLSKGIAAKVAAGETAYSRKPIPAELLDVYQRLVRHARAVLVSQLASRTRVTWELLDRFDAEFRALKHEHRGLTFADVTRALGRGWREGALQHLDFRLDSSIAHLLLDEFQDTSIPQWQALEPLARRVAEAADASLFCVGDQKQAIYGWRGGVAELFDHLRRSLPKIEESPLSRSFRSSPAVIDAVNRICRGLPRHDNLSDAEPAVRRWESRFDLHDTARSDLPGWVTLETPPAATDSDDGENHFDFAADRIAELAGTTPAATIGVLAVSNDSVADLARRLRVRGLHVSEEGSSSLNDNVPVQLILSLLQIADHPGDHAAWFHLASSPAASTLQAPLVRDPALVEEFSAKLRRELLHAGYGRCVERWAEAIVPFCDPRGVSRLRQLVDLAHDYEAHATLRTTDFVEFIESTTLRQPAASRIRVMTIHHAKGLEFDIVVLPELHKRLIAQTPQFVVGRDDPVEAPVCVMRYANAQLQGLLPENLQQVFQEAYERQVEERLCVLYVALTRARHALHMIVEPSKGGQSKLSLSMSHLIRASLLEHGALAPGQRLTISGREDWASEVWGPASDRSTDHSRATSVMEPAPLRIDLAPPVTGTVAGMPEVQPSRHGVKVIRMQDVLAAPRQARARGTLIHSWFEKLGWLDDGAPNDEALRRIARRLEPHEVDLERAIRDFAAMLRVPAIAWALSRQAYLAPEGLMAKTLRCLPAAEGLTLRVQNERRFAVPIDGEMIRGCMDRLVLLEQNGGVVAADVCDYKTDVLEGLDPLVVEERLAGYRQQLRLYVRAAARLYALPEERVSARLFLLGPGRVDEVC